MSAVAAERIPADLLNAGLTVKQLEPNIGAEVGGVDLREPLSPHVRDAIKSLLLRHRVIFFRDQPLSSEQQIALARQFGKIYEHPPHSLAFWDNRAGLHYAVVNYGEYPRELERVLIEDFDALPHY